MGTHIDSIDRGFALDGIKIIDSSFFNIRDCPIEDQYEYLSHFEGKIDPSVAFPRRTLVEIGTLSDRLALIHPGIEQSVDFSYIQGKLNKLLTRLWEHNLADHFIPDEVTKDDLRNIEKTTEAIFERILRGEDKSQADIDLMKEKDGDILNDASNYSYAPAINLIPDISVTILTEDRHLAKINYRVYGEAKIMKRNGVPDFFLKSRGYPNPDEEKIKVYYVRKDDGEGVLVDPDDHRKLSDIIYRSQEMQA